MGTASRLTIEEKTWPLLIVVDYHVVSVWGVKDSERAIFKEALKELGLGLENRMKVDINFFQVANVKL